MRFPRFTVRWLLLLVAVLGVVLGANVTLERRRENFRRRAAEYSAAVRSLYFADFQGDDGADWTALVAGEHADLAAKYKAAAKRPWALLESDEPQSDRVRAFWRAHEAVKKAYPGLSLGDYNVMVTQDDSDDQPIWAVRYRRRDHRSGLTVYLRDPIAIELHSEGPPQGSTEAK
jgi:hypothetical protein